MALIISEWPQFAPECHIQLQKGCRWLQNDPDSFKIAAAKFKMAVMSNSCCGCWDLFRMTQLASEWPQKVRIEFKDYRIE